MIIYRAGSGISMVSAVVVLGLAETTVEAVVALLLAVLVVLAALWLGLVTDAVRAAWLAAVAELAALQLAVASDALWAALSYESMSWQPIH